MHYYIKNILADAAGVAGLESIRRIVGIAKVKDITSIANIEKRAKAEKTVVLLAKQLIMERDNFQCGQDYIEAIFSIV